MTMTLKQTIYVCVAVMFLSFTAGAGIVDFTKPDCTHSPSPTYRPAKFAEHSRALFTGSPTFELAQADVVEPAPDLGEILAEGQGVHSTWKELGVLAGLIALVTFLIRLTKLGFMGAAIKRNKLEWIRPLLAMGAAGLTAAAAALVLGQDLPWVVLAGLVAGLAAPGSHEFLSSLQATFSREKRDKLQAKAKP